ncbi:MAG: PLP-dependent aminotransferase family protein [Pseudomonadota bacterium]
MTHWQEKFSPYAARIMPSAIFGLASMQRAPDTINLGPGEPDTGLFPAGQLADVISRTLRDPATAGRALQYTVNSGEPALRERICRYMRGKGVDCRPENILITSGAQQALDLLTELFVVPSARVAVQTPTYTGALGIFKAHGARIDSLDGLRASPAGGAAMVYANTNFQNPSGETLSVPERLELIALAEQADAILVEDDCYETMWFDEAPAPSILALELRGKSIEDARTFFVSTFSKSICPGLRVGWIVGAAAVIEQLTLMKQSEDFQAGTLVQIAVAELMDFIMDEHAPRLRGAYRARRDTMLAALERNFPEGVRWTQPSGGFFVWVTLPAHVDATALLPRAAQEGVTYVPGAAFSHDGSYTNALRLSYSSASLERIALGVQRLAAVVNAAGGLRAG